MADLIIPGVKPPTRDYIFAQPRRTHFRLASCEEVNCSALRNGWEVRLALQMPDHIDFIRSLKNLYTFTERQEGNEVVFIFPPGAGPRCFKWKQHLVRNDRPPLHVVRQAGKNRTHTQPEHWVEDYSEHLDKLRKEIG